MPRLKLLYLLILITCPIWQGYSQDAIGIAPSISIQVISPDTSCDRDKPNGVAQANVSRMNDDGNETAWPTEGFLLDWFSVSPIDGSLEYVASGTVLENIAAGTYYASMTSFGCTTVALVTIPGSSASIDNFTSCADDVVTLDFSSIADSTPIDSIVVLGGNGMLDFTDAVGSYIPTDAEFRVGEVELKVNLYVKDAACYPISKSLTIKLTKYPVIITNNSIPAGRPSGTFIGEFQVNACSLNDNFNFQVLNVNGGPNNSFSIIENRLYSSRSFSNGETLNVLLRANDQNDTFDFTISINVLPESVNVTPYDFTLSNNVISKTPEIGATVGIFSVIDQDFTDSHFFKILSLNGVPLPTEPFIIDGAEIKIGTNLIDPLPRYDMRVEVLDQAGNSLIREFEIITNEPPADVVLSNLFINELEEPLTRTINGTTFYVGCFEGFQEMVYIGSLSAVGKGPFSSTFSLVEGFGSDDNGQFIVAGQELFAEPFDLSNETSDIKKIRIRATDEFGDWYEKAFDIKINDITPPEITDVIAPDELIVGNPFVLSNVTTNDNFKVDYVDLHARGILSAGAFDTTRIESTNNQYYFNITGDLLDDFGLEYFFAVYDEANNYFLSDTFLIYNKYLASNSPVIPDLISDGSVNTYEMISIPYQLVDPRVSQVLEADLGAPNKDDWRLLHYDNASSTNIEYPDQFTDFALGLGYWFNATVDVSRIEIGEATVPKYTRNLPFTLELQQGWNQIGNPFDRELDWDYVRNHEANQNNPDIQELIIFDKGSYAATTVLKPFRGAWLYANEATDIAIPLPMNSAAGRVASTSHEALLASDIDAPNWFIALGLKNAHSNTKIFGLGMSEDALDQRDALDRVTVPRFINYLDLSFNQSADEEPYRINIVNSSEEYTWEFVVASNYEAPTTTLDWDNTTLVDTDKALILFDRDEQLLVDMSSVSSYEFQLSGTNKFKVYYGDRQSLRESITPEMIFLGNPYPNPLTRGTNLTIPFTLPPSGSAYQMQMELINATGAVVGVTQDSQLGHGFHEVTWDLDNSLVQPGLHIIRLSIAGDGVARTISKRIVIK